MSTIASDATARADIIRRREAGESLQAIGNRYGISRERVRQLCKRWDVHPHVDRKRITADKAERALELLRTGKVFSIEEASREAGVSSKTLRCLAGAQGIDLVALRDRAVSHRYDGQTWDFWTAIDGGYIYESPQRRWQMCRCVCGTERRVQMGNLIRGNSRGCGCRNSTGRRRRVPWVCDATGERHENTTALARHLGMNLLMLYPKIHSGRTHTDQKGNVWRPLPEEATAHRPDRNQRRAEQ